MRGTNMVDRTVASLSAGQAAGTTAVIAANSDRRSLMINPPADCSLGIVSGTGVWPLFAGVPNTIVGLECPTNALFVIGLAEAAALPIWEG